jgi:hypothetical protein
LTKTVRKARTDSIPNMTRVMQGAKRELAPPSHVPLEDVDWPFWESVVQEFARADWTEHQLELAAMLARTMANLEREQRLLREEGGVIVKEIKDNKGETRKIVLCVNARARSVSDTMSQVLSMRRSLALHAKAKSGTNGDAGKQRAANKKIESVAAANEDDDLLS